jgi:hypothetical protein
MSWIQSLPLLLFPSLVALLLVALVVRLTSRLIIEVVGTTLARIASSLACLGRALPNRTSLVKTTGVRSMGSVSIRGGA